MALSVRISPLEVQVGRFVYAFEEYDEADSFEACVTAINVRYCEAKHPCVAKKAVDEHSKGQNRPRSLRGRTQIGHRIGRGRR
jgi:hypothetical protein